MSIEEDEFDYLFEVELPECSTEMRAMMDTIKQLQETVKKGTQARHIYFTMWSAMHCLTTAIDACRADRMEMRLMYRRLKIYEMMLLTTLEPQARLDGGGLANRILDALKRDSQRKEQKPGLPRQSEATAGDADKQDATS